MRRRVVINSIYKHFKGDLVKVLYIAKNSETLQDMVVYEHKNQVWVRPYDMFISKIDKEKYPDCNQKYRFELVDNND